jgi:hypothetical protein
VCCFVAFLIFLSGLPFCLSVCLFACLPVYLFCYVSVCLFCFMCLFICSVLGVHGDPSGDGPVPPAVRRDRGQSQRRAAAAGLIG